MADRPILFSGPMVRALLAGKKTNTRRVANPQPDTVIMRNGKRLPQSLLHVEGEAVPRVAHGNVLTEQRAPCAPGDRLWVREAHQMANSGGGPVICYRADNHRWQPPFTGPDFGAGPSFDYEKYPGEYSIWAADLESADHPWRPSIYMPRWCSRITCIVTDVRIERLQDITDDGAAAEGVRFETADPPFYYVPGVWPHSLTAVGIEEPGGDHAVRSFAKYWNLLNAKRSYGWDVNPWVFVIVFETALKNIDRLEA